MVASSVQFIALISKISKPSLIQYQDSEYIAKIKRLIAIMFIVYSDCVAIAIATMVSYCAVRCFLGSYFFVINISPHLPREIIASKLKGS